MGFFSMGQWRHINAFICCEGYLLTWYSQVTEGDRSRASRAWYAYPVELSFFYFLSFVLLITLENVWFSSTLPCKCLCAFFFKTMSYVYIQVILIKYVLICSVFQTFCFKSMLTVNYHCVLLDDVAIENSLPLVAVENKLGSHVNNPIKYLHISI